MPLYYSFAQLCFCVSVSMFLSVFVYMFPCFFASMLLCFWVSMFLYLCVSLFLRFYVSMFFVYMFLVLHLNTPVGQITSPAQSLLSPCRRINLSYFFSLAEVPRKKPNFGADSKKRFDRQLRGPMQNILILENTVLVSAFSSMILKNLKSRWEPLKNPKPNKVWSRL
jgi:hypothetical protein